MLINRLNAALALLMVLIPASSFAEDVMPVLLTHQEPNYPRLLRRKGVEGIAIIQFTVDPDGSVESPLAVGYTDEELGRATVKAVSKWKYEPPKHNGQAVACTLCVSETFTLSTKTSVGADTLSGLSELCDKLQGAWTTALQDIVDTADHPQRVDRLKDWNLIWFGVTANDDRLVLLPEVRTAHGDLHDDAIVRRVIGPALAKIQLSAALLEYLRAQHTMIVKFVRPSLYDNY